MPIDMDEDEDGGSK